MRVSERAAVARAGESSHISCAAQQKNAAYLHMYIYDLKITFNDIQCI